MQFFSWMALCVIVSCAWHHRPLFLSLAAMTMWVVLPGVGSSLVTGVTTGALAVHPASVLVLVACLVRAVLAPREMLAPIAHRPEWFILLSAVSGISLVIGVFEGYGPDSAAAAINQVVAPACLFFVLGSSLLLSPTAGRYLVRWFIAVAALQAAFAIVQLAVQSPVLYVAQYADQAFFRQNLNRWMGTTDHPLILSFMLVLALFLLASLRRVVLILPLMLTLLGGILVTQSRVGVVVGSAAALYVVGRAPLRRASHRVVLMVPLAAGVAIALQLGAADAIQARVLDDSGSSSARADALTYFLDHINDYLWIGHGLNGSFSVSDNAGLGTSFESAVLMYAIDIGLVATVVYFLVMVWATLRSLRATGFGAATGAALAALVIPQSFSALSGNTAAPMLVWAIFALAGFGPADVGARTVRSPPGPTRRVRSSRLDSEPALVVTVR